MLVAHCQVLTCAPPQGYTRTGFNKVHRSLRVREREVSLTVWDTSGGNTPDTAQHFTLLVPGLASYCSLRPLVYRDASVVLLCYSSGAQTGLRAWAAEVRRSTRAPVVLVRTKADCGAREEMVEAMAVAEEIGAVSWEETSAKTGHHVELAFSLCGLAAWRTPVPRTQARVQRPSSLSLTLGPKPSLGHLYEDPDSVKVPARRPGLAFPRLGVAARPASTRGSDTDSLLSPQSRKSLVLDTRHGTLLSPTAPPRPLSSQSAQIRPSRLYRHSVHRLSSGGRLKPVAIPLSPNCDMGQGGERYLSDTSSILSPTDSTVSSLLSHPALPPYRNSRVLALPSPSSSQASAPFLPFSPVSRSSSDRDSVSSAGDSLGDGGPRAQLRSLRSKRPTGCGWRLFDSQIEEVEEEGGFCASGAPGKLVVRAKKERCSLM